METYLEKFNAYMMNFVQNPNLKRAMWVKKFFFLHFPYYNLKIYPQDTNTILSQVK